MNTKVTPRPVPRPTQASQPFWDGAKKKQLWLQYDPVSRRYQFWPRICSVRTGKLNLRWRKTSGKGIVYSYTDTYVAAPGFADKAPYLVGLIELDEGVRIIGNIINVKAEDFKIGMKVKVAWEALSDDINYFAFEPAK